MNTKTMLDVMLDAINHEKCMVSRLECCPCTHGDQVHFEDNVSTFDHMSLQPILYMWHDVAKSLPQAKRTTLSIKTHFIYKQC